MSILQLQGASKAFGMKVLFERAGFSVNEGEHLGVIGPNGAGKTTLFRVLTGQLQLDEGDLTKAQSLRIGYLEQESAWPADQSCTDYLASHCRKPIWELQRLAHDLGLTDTHLERPWTELSGGYRMRMKLLYLLGMEPNLMLLDEPTNFLDLESVLALEAFLQDYAGAFMLISHDREFLRRTTESTLEIEGGDITKFPGHIDDYFEHKASLREILVAQAANLDAKRRHVQEFVDRFRAKATKARQAQSRLKQLEKMDRIELKDLAVEARIRIPAPGSTGKECLSLSGADLGYGPKIVLRDVRIRLERGDHVGVVGHNGAGKSTLLKSLAGVLPLAKGDLKLGHQVTMAYYSQHVAERLDPDDTVLDAMERAAIGGLTGLTTQDVKNLAGSLLFSGDDIRKKIKVLSGGEKSRVALGQILLARAPLLLLDEPTNHLDFATVEALTEALRDYPGTVVVVSHDRSFIGRIANRILEIDAGKVELYPGSYDEYVWSLQKGALKERAADAAKPETSALAGTTSPAKLEKFNFKEMSKQLRGQAAELRRKISKCEEILHALGQKRDGLTHELLAAAGDRAQVIAKDLGQCAKEIERVEQDLLSHMENLDAKEKELANLREK